MSEPTTIRPLHGARGTHRACGTHGAREAHGSRAGNRAHGAHGGHHAHGALALSLAALMLLLPTGLGAQVDAQPAGPDAAAAAHRKADAILATARIAGWPSAARLLEQAADARAPEDATAVDERITAAELFHFTGSLERAQSNLDSAAEQSLTEGHVFQAAMLLLKAATVAKERGQFEAAKAFARSAQWLARSPQLSPAEYAEIRDGVNWLPPEGRSTGS